MRFGGRGGRSSHAFKVIFTYSYGKYKEGVSGGGGVGKGRK